MDILYLILGGVILVSAIVDILWTTLWVDGGAGPLSSRLSTWVWRGLRRVSQGRSRLLSLAGPLILVLTLGIWVSMIWAGWTFVFAGGESALIDTRDTGPISWTERGWYVAYTMFTDGNGDFTPDGGVWQIASSLTTASGMLFVTMGVSYILSILGAVAEKRSFAKSVTGIGEQSEEFVLAGWRGGDLHDLNLPLNSLSSELDTLAAQHKSYPILHYYHSEKASDSSAMAVAIFDEALTIIESGISDDVESNRAVIQSARSSTEDYIQTLHTAFIQPADRTPPPPELDRLRNNEIPTVSDETFADHLGELAERRRKLLATVRADAWYWPSQNDE